MSKRIQDLILYRNNLGELRIQSAPDGSLDDWEVKQTAPMGAYLTAFQSEIKMTVVLIERPNEAETTLYAVMSNRAGIIEHTETIIAKLNPYADYTPLIEIALNTLVTKLLSKYGL